MLQSVLTAFDSYVQSYPIFGARLLYYKFRATGDREYLRRGWEVAKHYNVEKELILAELGATDDGRAGDGRRNRVSTLRQSIPELLDHVELRKIGRELSPKLPSYAVEVFDALLEVWGRKVEGTVKEAKKFIKTYVMQPEGGEDIKIGRVSAAIVELIYEHVKLAEC